MTDKYQHVRAAGQTRDHQCHCPGCPKQVPPAVWGCKRCWFNLPDEIRRDIWAAYVAGQEISGTPSADYLKAARHAQDWLKANPHDHGGKKPSRQLPLILGTLVALMLGGCAPIPPPIVDLAGVDPVLYHRDLAQCSAVAASIPLAFGNPLTRCMRDRGYTVLFSN